MTGIAGAPALHRHHVEAAAAQIGDQAVGIGNAGDHAFGGDARFVLAGQHAHRRAPGALRRGARIPRRWRRRAPPPSPPPRAPSTLEPVGEHAEARQRLQRQLRSPRVCSRPVVTMSRPMAQIDLFVLHGRGGARSAIS